MRVLALARPPLPWSSLCSPSSPPLPSVASNAGYCTTSSLPPPPRPHVVLLFWRRCRRRAPWRRRRNALALPAMSELACPPRSLAGAGSPRPLTRANTVVRWLRFRLPLLTSRFSQTRRSLQPPRFFHCSRTDGSLSRCVCVCVRARERGREGGICQERERLTAATTSTAAAS